ncbi:MAG: DUF1501 domain-containing protein [Flavobacteriales bacterium]|nr:DUF1501 domain-containing protein [Flavobacteriales bacterium]
MKAIASAALDKKGDFNDYKALVCILLDGGADSHNMLIPRGNFEYGNYLTTRSNLAIPQSQVLPLNGFASGQSFGVHPDMPQIQNLYNSGRLAWIANVGTLIEPITKQQYESNSGRTPLGLFSHSDQIKHWQTGRPGERSSHGWAGRIADLIQQHNSNPNLSMNISLSGNNFFQSGQTINEFSIKSNGEFGLNGSETQNSYHNLRNDAIKSMLERDYEDMYKKTYVNTLSKALDGSQGLTQALSDAGTFNLQFSNTTVSKQLEMIAKVIAAKDELAFNRQTFFVKIGGWDHHDEVLESQQEMLPELDLALGEFMSALEKMGLSEDVTTFTISDFGRTLTSNGDGSDHAWGGNTMVMGGAVNGGNIYGTYPSLEMGNELMLPRGVMIPTTSTSEYFAELASWFGVGSSDLFEIFPDLQNFYSTGSGLPVGFMNLSA